MPPVSTLYRAVRSDVSYEVFSSLLERLGRVDFELSGFRSGYQNPVLNRSILSGSSAPRALPDSRTCRPVVRYRRYQGLAVKPLILELGFDGFGNFFVADESGDALDLFAGP